MARVFWEPLREIESRERHRATGCNSGRVGYSRPRFPRCRTSDLAKTSASAKSIAALGACVEHSLPFLLLRPMPQTRSHNCSRDTTRQHHREPPTRHVMNQPPVTLICRDTDGRLVRRSITKSWPFGLRLIASSTASATNSLPSEARSFSRKSAASSLPRHM